MNEQFSNDINPENNKENKIKFDKFDNILIKIIIIINKIITLLKIQLLRTKEKKESILGFDKEEIQKLFSCFKNEISEVKNDSIITIHIKENKLSKKFGNEIKENQNKQKKNNIKNIIIINVIFIIINMLCAIKSKKIFDSFYFQYSSTIKLKIKGTGNKNLFGNEEGHIFPSIDYLEEVKINGQIKNTKEYQYYFDQTVNTVELKWDENINDCGYMFWKCSDITEIDLSNFKNSQVTQMNAMFAYCSSLTSINLSNLDTMKVLSMNWMFAYCSSLNSLDLSNFNTAEVRNMNTMFGDCTLLTSLDLSKFDTSKVEKIFDMFYNCIKLEYINLNNFNEIKLSDYVSKYNNMFYNVPENVVICIDSRKVKNKIYPQITSKKFYVINCSSDWKLYQKILINNNQCVQSCGERNIYLNKANVNCYYNCKKVSKYENEDETYECDCDSNECLLCPNIPILCLINTDFNYYPKENDPFNDNGYINFYKSLEGYYLDNNIYKPCYPTCKTCDIGGNNMNHNCKDCGINYQMKFAYNNSYNCHPKCSYYYYFDENNNYQCTVDLSCPNKFSKLIEDKKECIKNNIKNNVEGIILDKSEIENMSNERQIEYYDNIINNIEKVMPNYDTSEIDKGQDEVIEVGKTTWTFTSVDNQKNNINKNVSIIDLGDCEISLRQHYNIPKSQKLYIKKIDIVQDGMKASKVEYDVYCRLFGTNLIKLNLTACAKDKILIYKPFDINGNLDEYNSSSGYYNDVCYTTTSEDGTDISLKDRKKNFIKQDLVVCQEGCAFAKYENSKALCTCNAKESSSSITDMTIDKAKLVIENFKDIKNLANFNFLICYQKFFQKENIIYNIGSYLLLVIIIFHIITIFIFYIKQFPLLKKKINNIILGIYKLKSFGNNKKLKKINIKRNTTKIFKNKNIRENSARKKMIMSKKVPKRIFNQKNKIHKFKRGKIANINFNNNIKKNKIIYNNITTNKVPETFNKNKKSCSKLNISKKLETKRVDNTMKYTDAEVNSLSYDLARLYDKRTYCQYYISLLKTKHGLIFALNNKDYNSTIIKIDVFLIGFTIDLVVNALFFNDDTMNNIYERKGEYDWETQIPIIAYSTLISMVLNLPIGLLALSDDTIISFKQNKSKINLTKRGEELKKKLNIKFILYFIIGFLILAFFWYYIAMFCVIYKNTQLHLIKDTGMSLGLSLLIPFGTYLLPGLFRIPALSNRKNKRKCLYNFSKILQLI